MEKTLSQQMDEAVYYYLDQHEGENLSDQDWVEVTKSICNKIAEKYALQKQIEENESILKMLELHGDERCALVVRDRIFTLQKQLEDGK